MSRKKTITKEQIWEVLQEVTDPEIPAVSLVELGIVREIEQDDNGKVTVTITPTFSGCPALHVMKRDIKERLEALGIQEVEVQTTLSPAWSSDMISEEGRAKLRDFGIGPPPTHGGSLTIALYDEVVCPYCHSDNTSIRNEWGPTPCRMIFFCDNCIQPFEQFKPL